MMGLIRNPPAERNPHFRVSNILANVFEVAILEYVKRHHIAVPTDAAVLAVGDLASTNKEEQPR